jgi:hypothetical protein
MEVGRSCKCNPSTNLSNLGFSARMRKSGEVEIRREGRTVAVVRGPKAEQLVSGRLSAEEAQQLMARLTGNYKRGNEGLAAVHERNQR